MRSVRYTIEFSDGVKVPMLFTPHLYSFKGTQGVTFEVSDLNNTSEVVEAYADVLFCAALNAFVLDGNGSVEEFPYKRGDFHEFMMCQPESFGKALNFALEALTGKSVKEINSDAQKGAANANTGEETSKKKESTRWIGRRLRNFS